MCKLKFTATNAVAVLLFQKGRKMLFDSIGRRSERIVQFGSDDGFLFPKDFKFVFHG